MKLSILRNLWAVRILNQLVSCVSQGVSNSGKSEEKRNVNFRPRSRSSVHAFIQIKTIKKKRRRKKKQEILKLEAVNVNKKHKFICI